VAERGETGKTGGSGGSLPCYGTTTPRRSTSWGSTRSWPVLSAVAMPHLDPLTIGIHGPLRGGMSTILGLLEAELAADAGYIVVRTNPWEYEDQLDVKGTLIAQVLQAFEDRFGETAGIREKIQGLLERISLLPAEVLVRELIDIWHKAPVYGRHLGRLREASPIDADPHVMSRIAWRFVPRYPG
jgi:hypothetical protein